MWRVYPIKIRDELTRHSRLGKDARDLRKPNRDAADYFNVGELCVADCGRSSIAINDVGQQLGIPLEELRLFEWSSNNREATDGRPRALQTRINRPPTAGVSIWSPDRMRDVVAEMIRAWVGANG